jgi:predicted transcriptional regulator
VGHAPADIEHPVVELGIAEAKELGLDVGALAALVPVWFAPSAILCGNYSTYHGATRMLNIAASLVGSLELAIMECFWATPTQTGGQILATLRKERRIAHTTVTTTLARLYDQGLLTRAPIAGPGSRQSWIYTARYASRGALLAATMETLAVQIGANHRDRAEALVELRSAIHI